MARRQCNCGRDLQTAGEIYGIGENSAHFALRFAKTLTALYLPTHATARSDSGKSSELSEPQLSISKTQPE